MMTGLITVDGSGTVLFANQTAERLTGYGQLELQGCTSRKLIIDSQWAATRTRSCARCAWGRKAFQQDAWLLKKDGTKDPILVNTSLLLDEKKQPQGALAVFSDITQQRRMEEQIAHLDKLAALGRFSSSIAHEIRNPLTGIAAGIQYCSARARSRTASARTSSSSWKKCGASTG
jgi:PAS domain S-box-containing protein